MKKLELFERPIFLFLILIVIASAVRIYFFQGLVFSDDSYYAELAGIKYSGGGSDEYIGYPIFLLRKLHTLVTAFFFFIFGAGEISFSIFPFFTSLANIYLIYLIAKLVTGGDETAILSVFLITFFPTDITFATINFADAQNAFVINLGIYFFIKSIRQKNLLISAAAGLLFFISMLFKENVYFVIWLGVFLLIFSFIKRNDLLKYLITALAVFAAGLIIEGVYYLYAENDIFYRLTIINANFKYCYYDFFPYTVAGYFSGDVNYFSALLKQMFLLNPKYLFLRRFNLFIPTAALLQSVLNLREKKNAVLTVWFAGLAVLMLWWTVSFTNYSPLELRRSWYIFIILPPALIMTSSLLLKLKRYIRLPLLALYVAAGLWMSTEYQTFFDQENLSRLKKFVRDNTGAVVYSDFHTVYGLKLVDGYADNSRFPVINSEVFSAEDISPGEFLLINRDELHELRKQGNYIPDFKNSLDQFKLIDIFGKFKLFKKL